jgi:signal transduction histidine kinase/DNA-binding NarL/FixJ family response regulator/uncharacterized protein YutD
LGRITKNSAFALLVMLSLGLNSESTCAQSYNRLDSLERVLQVTTNNITKIELYLELSSEALPQSSEVAKRFVNRALAIAGNIEHKEGLVRSYVALGHIATVEQSYLEAIAKYRDALSIEMSRNNWADVSMCHNYIGEVYFIQERTDSALYHFNRAIANGNVSANDESFVRAYCNIGNLHYAQGNVQKAVDHYERAIDRMGQRKSYGVLALPYYHIGLIELDAGDRLKARESFMSALRIAGEGAPTAFQAEVNHVVGCMFLEEKSTARALVYLHQSLDLAHRSQSRKYLIAGYQKLSEAYDQAGDVDNAEKYQGYYATIKDKKYTAEIEATLDTERLRNDLLDAENGRKLAEAEVRNSYIITITLTSGVVLMGVFLFFIIGQYRAKNRTALELQAAIEQVERSEAEKEKFLAYTSHEIRTPLNALVGMIQLLKNTTMSRQQKKYVDTVKSSSDNILVIVNDILDLSRIESGKIDFEHVDFMLTELIEEIVYMMRPKAQGKGIELRAELHKEIPAVVKGDPLRINQILLNLVSNAVKFTEEGEVVLGAHLLTESDGKVKIGFTVTDSGIGIKKDKLSSVFNRFEQEDSHTTRKYGGAGLGLSITKQLVELQGGNVSVRSTYGEGTVFSVRLEFPKGSSSVDTIKSVDRRNSIPPEQLDHTSILVVDDNILNVQILVDLLSNWNNTLHIETAEDGRVAVQKIAAAQYDVVLMDIQMPRMNGYTATRYIREQMEEPKRSLPVIAMTAHALSRIEEDVREAGMDDYISKPIDIDDLTAKISKLVKAKRVRPKPKNTNTYRTIDLSNLRELTRNDGAKIIKYIDIFIKNVPADLESMKQNMLDEDWSALSKAAHKMKGNSAYMGIEELNELFQAAQNYDDVEMEPEDIEAMVRKIDEVVLRAIRELKMVKEELLATG